MFLHFYVIDLKLFVFDFCGATALRGPRPPNVEVSRLQADTFTIRRTSLDEGSVCR